jgi:hypothetical protein
VNRVVGTVVAAEVDDVVGADVETEVGAEVVGGVGLDPPQAASSTSTSAIAAIRRKA